MLWGISWVNIRMMIFSIEKQEISDKPDSRIVDIDFSNISKILKG